MGTRFLRLIVSTVLLLTLSLSVIAAPRARDAQPQERAGIWIARFLAKMFGPRVISNGDTMTVPRP